MILFAKLYIIKYNISEIQRRDSEETIDVEGNFNNVINSFLLFPIPYILAAFEFLTQFFYNASFRFMMEEIITVARHHNPLI